MKRLLRLLALSALLPAAATAAGPPVDSVVTFNELMYHPREEASGGEWIELYNPMAVDVDMSEWELTGGVDFEFPDGTVIPSRGFLIVAATPGAFGEVNGPVLGPFPNRLSNGGEVITLRNNSGRLMDEIEYSDGGDWPSGPDGSGSTLAKIDADTASWKPENWATSLQAAGTPGAANFPPPSPPADQTLVELNDTWRYHSAEDAPATNWNAADFDDSSWDSAPAAFFQGQFETGGERTAISTLFSTGIGDDGQPLPPGTEDPHYYFTNTGGPVIVMQNHQAWLANSNESVWVGSTGQGTTSVDPGTSVVGTTFSLNGWDAETASISLRAAADNELAAVRLNGVNQNIRVEGFSSLSQTYTLNGPFQPGDNEIEFVFVNEGTSPNPAGLRIQVTGTAVSQVGATELSGSANSRYFRNSFSYSPELEGERELYLEVLVDDGAAFYLNGEEVYRHNLPDGPLDASTTAVEDVDQAARVTVGPLPANSLVEGGNVLAVRTFQASGGEDDMLFDASLATREYAAAGRARSSVQFSESAGALDADFFVELRNPANTPANLQNLVLEHSGSGTRVGLSEASLAAGEYLVLDEQLDGLTVATGEKLFLLNADTDAVVDTVEIKNRARGRLSGRTEWYFTASATPGAANDVALQDAIVINEIMYHHQPQKAREGIFSTTSLLPIDATWRYYDGSGGLPAGWAATRHEADGVNWVEGQALLGITSSASALPEPVRTELSGGRLTRYFETEFEVESIIDGAQLMISHIIDDGAIIYLNGQELARYNMPSGTVSQSTLAGSDIGNAQYEGSVTLTPENLVEGTNRISVEVHQGSIFSSDMIFGLQVVAALALDPPAEYSESGEEWIELYNRGDAAVDLSGWTLGGGIDFAFPAVTLEPGEFLVVSNNSAELSTKYPDSRIVGDFDRGLSNASDTITLNDAANNPADTVTYYDRGKWHYAADGQGSSLELRDPDADNSKALAWASSVESDKSEWQSVSYVGVNEPPQGSDNPVRWNELVFGLLDSGEILIDDLSVRDLETGAELIQDGGFTNGLSTYRLLGNHGFGKITQDPENASNNVLHLIATGSTEHMHNHVETTFAGNASLVSGREYRVSYRAKWLTGSNSLNTRLYFNRLARTTNLATPRDNGTPGASNSVAVENMGPTYSGFIHSPAVPDSSEDVTVTVSAEDRDGVDLLSLRYRVNGGGWQSAAMEETSPGGYEGMIPAQSTQSVVQFYVIGEDSLGATTTFPAGGPESRAMYEVESSPASRQQHRHNFRIVMHPQDYAELRTLTNVMTNHRYGATVICNEEEIYYDVGARIKGSGYGRPGAARAGFNLRSQPDKLFRGAHWAIAIDRSQGPFGTGISHREIVLRQIGNRAGGSIPSFYDDVVTVHAPNNELSGPATLMLARYDDVFLESNFENGGDGTAYEYELVYWTGQATGGAEGLKLPPNPSTGGGVLGVPLRDLGEDKENYRWTYLIKNNRSVDDFSGPMALGNVIGLPTSVLRQQLPEVIDVDQWARVLALESLGLVNDTYNGGLAHNIYFYKRPSDGRMLALPWDNDFAFHRGTNSSLYGDAPEMQRVFSIPEFKRLFDGHLYDLTQTAFNLSYINPWVQHYADRGGAATSQIVSSISARRSFVLSRMPGNVSFRITTNSGNSFEVGTNEVALRGEGWIDVREIHVQGLGPVAVDWLDYDTWLINVPLSAGSNAIQLTALDHNGDQVGSDSIAVTNTGSIEAASSGNIVVSKIMYHPSDPTDEEIQAGFDDQDLFEYIELMAVSENADVAIDLSGVRFDSGIEFDFANADITRLDAGQRLLIVKNRAAFELRHGDSLPVAGEYGETNLSNSGESLRLLDTSGNVIRDFQYDDGSPWPETADGQGPSLVLVDPQSLPAHALAANWRASYTVGGNPGGEDEVPQGGFESWRQGHFTAAELADPSISGEEADADNDGMANLLEYAFGSDPRVNDAQWPTVETVVVESGDTSAVHLAIVFPMAADAEDIEISVETSEDFATWTDATEEFSSAAGYPFIHPDDADRESHKLVDDTPISGSRKYVRLRIERVLP